MLMRSVYSRSADLTDEEWSRRKGLIALLSAAADILVMAGDQLSTSTSVLVERSETETAQASISCAHRQVLEALWFVGKQES